MILPPNGCGSTDLVLGEAWRSMTAPLLRANAVCKTYQMPDHLSRLVLDHVDFTLRDGEIVAILGKSGSGKSTFLRILAGLIPASDGAVEYRGQAGERTGARHRDGVSKLRAVPVADGARQCRAGSRSARSLGRRSPPAGGRCDRSDRPRRVRERLSEGAVWRHAAACRICPRTRRQSRYPAARRAVLVARRADRGDPAQRSARPVGRPAHPDQGNRVGVAQYRRSGRNRRPHSDLRQRSRPHPRRYPDHAAAPASLG